VVKKRKSSLKEGKNHGMVRQQDVEKGKERAGKPRQKGRAGEDVIGRLNWIATGTGLGIVEHDVV
jgi:hypothetical protein